MILRFGGPRAGNYLMSIGIAEQLHTHSIQESLHTQVSGLSAERELKLLGISSQWELERYYAVSARHGDDIAFREIQRNVRAYEREFVRDVPVSSAHSYYHIDGGLYSEPIKDDELFLLEAQIDPRERDGRTLGGFQQFQELATSQTSQEEIVAWYSPAGRAGSIPPFSDIHYDSGRLYFCFKNSSSESIHIDIKIKEDVFPIQELLKQLEYISGTCRDPNSEQNLDQYLDSPFSIVIPHRELLGYLQDFGAMQDAEGNVGYVSQRDTNHQKVHSVLDMMEILANEIQLNNHNQPSKQLIYEDNRPTQMTRAAIQHMYLAPIAQQMERNGGSSIALYGCSTTTAFDISSGDVGSLMGSISNYSSSSRVLSSGGSLTDSMELSMSSIGKKDKNKLHCTCPLCNKKVWAEIKNNKIICPKCKESRTYNC